MSPNKKLSLPFLCAGLSLFFFQIQVYALPQDSGKSLRVSADSTLLNYKNGFNIYEGHVKIDQGETHLTADRATTQRNENQKLKEAVAYGTHQLAHYWTEPHAGEPLFHARARVIKFYPLTSQIILQGSVIVTQGNNSFQGPEIIYNLKDRTILAPKTKNGRSTITIEQAQLAL